MSNVSSFGQASVEAVFSGDRSVECLVPQIVPTPEDIFAATLHLWKDGFDTTDLAEILNISEGHAYHLVNEYYAKRYSLGFGSRRDARLGVNA